MELADAGFGDVEQRGDLSLGQFLLVVEGEEELIAIGQRLDRGAEFTHAVVALGAGGNICGARVGQLRLQVSVVLVVGVEQLVEADRDPGGVGDDRVVAVKAEAERLGDLLLFRLPPQLLAQGFGRLVQLTLVRTDGTRETIGTAQLVEHGAADAADGVGLELDAEGGVEASDGLDQADGAGRDHVVVVHDRRRDDGEASENVLDERRVLQDQRVAQRGRRLHDEALPARVRHFGRG